MNVAMQVIRDEMGRVLGSETHEWIDAPRGGRLMQVKHQSMDVIRDESGRVLRSETHEWMEGDAHAKQHTAAQRTHADEVVQLRAKNETLLAEQEKLVSTLTVAVERLEAHAGDYGAGYQAGLQAQIAMTMHDAVMQEEEEAGR